MEDDLRLTQDHVVHGPQSLSRLSGFLCAVRACFTLCTRAQVTLDLHSECGRLQRRRQGGGGGSSVISVHFWWLAQCGAQVICHDKQKHTGCITCWLSRPSTRSQVNTLAREHTAVAKCRTQ